MKLYCFQKVIFEKSSSYFSVELKTNSKYYLSSTGEKPKFVIAVGQTGKLYRLATFAQNSIFVP